MNAAYIKELSSLFMWSTYTRQVASYGISHFSEPQVHAKLREIAKNNYNNHAIISHLIWDYIQAEGITLQIDFPGFRTNSSNFANFESYSSRIELVVHINCKTIADIGNEIIKGNEVAFQSAIRLAATALKYQIEDLHDQLFSDYGILHAIAMCLISNEIASYGINYRNSLILWPYNTKVDGPSLPLSRYDFSGPHRIYKPPTFVIFAFDGENGQFKEGMKIKSIQEGTLISPYSPSATAMARDITGSWIEQLRKDNEITLDNVTPKNEIGSSAAESEPAETIDKQKLVLLICGFLILFVLFFGFMHLVLRVPLLWFLK